MPKLMQRILNKTVKRFKFPDAMPHSYAKNEENLKIVTLLVENLPTNTTSDELAQIFNDYGIVKRCSVDYTPQRELLDIGMVEIDERGAHDAIQDLKTTIVNGKFLKVQIQAETPRHPKFIKGEYKQMDKAPTYLNEWKRQADQWEAKYHPKKK
jgi:RNA recognition motif-containing protein